MESVDLDMGEIFDDGRDDDDIGAPAVLQDLPEGVEQEHGENDEDAENTEVLSRLKDLSKGAAKKVIGRPQPKLDPTRLTGERGIPILPNVCEKLKFKGKGYETQDLGTIMRALEHWGHRLFPKMPFDEVLERCERLGAKREVQTCIKKMRLGMPVLGDDFIGSDKDDDGGDDDVVRRNKNDDRVNAEDEWDNMLRGEANTNSTQPKVTPGPPLSDDLDLDLAGPSTSTAGALPQGQPSTPGPSTSANVPQDNGITPDQLERMERNREMARQKRLAKMGIRGSPASPLPNSQLAKSQPGPSTMVSTGSSQPSPRLQLPATTEAGDGVTRSLADTTDAMDIEPSIGGSKDRDDITDRSASGKTVCNKDKVTSKTEQTIQKSDIEMGKIDSTIEDAVEESEMEMSVVLEKQQNCEVKLNSKASQDIQHENSQSEIVNDSGESKDTNSMLNEECEVSSVIEKPEKVQLHLVNKTIQNGHTDLCNDSTGSVVGENGDSAEMSEIFKYQEANTKPKPLVDFQNIQKDSEEMSDLIPKQNLSQNKSKTKLDKISNEEDQSCIDSDTTIHVDANKENTSGDNRKTLNKVSVNETGDNAIMDDFDEELTEEQLMETLE